MGNKQNSTRNIFINIIIFFCLKLVCLFSITIKYAILCLLVFFVLIRLILCRGPPHISFQNSKWNGGNMNVIRSR